MHIWAWRGTSRLDIFRCHLDVTMLLKVCKVLVGLQAESGSRDPPFSPFFPIFSLFRFPPVALQDPCISLAGNTRCAPVIRMEMVGSFFYLKKEGGGRENSTDTWRIWMQLISIQCFPSDLFFHQCLHNGNSLCLSLNFSAGSSCIFYNSSPFQAKPKPEDKQHLLKHVGLALLFGWPQGVPSYVQRSQNAHGCSFHLKPLMMRSGSSQE